MHDYFRPYTKPQPWRYCHYLVRLEPASGTALYQQDGQIDCVAQPDYGCSFWQREPGSDDDLDSATGVPCQDWIEPPPSAILDRTGRTDGTDRTTEPPAP